MKMGNTLVFVLLLFVVFVGLQKAAKIAAPYVRPYAPALADILVS